MSFVAIGVGVGTTALGAGLSYATRPSYSSPNVAAQSQAISNANSELLPLQRGFEAAAQEGGDFTFQLPAGVDPSQYGFDKFSDGQQQQQQVFVPNTGAARLTNGAGQWVPYDPSDWQSGGKYASLGAPETRTVSNNNGKYTVSFKGYGAGDTQSTLAKQAAASNLALAQKYDPQFIASSLAQEQEADPQSYAARQEENKLIQQQIDNPIENPTADMLADQVDQQIKAGRGLDSFDQQALDSATQSALSDRGGNAPAGTDFSEPLTTGFAGINRQMAGAGKGIAELSSGSSPEDIAYRREQQNLANLSALVNGATPESQFSSLSGAQRGPTPTVAPSMSLAPNNAYGTGAQSALTQSGLTNNYQAGQSNGWLAGATAAINGATAIGKGMAP